MTMARLRRRSDRKWCTLYLYRQRSGYISHLSGVLLLVLGDTLLMIYLTRYEFRTNLTC